MMLKFVLISYQDVKAYSMRCRCVDFGKMANEVFDISEDWKQSINTATGGFPLQRQRSPSGNLLPPRVRRFRIYYYYYYYYKSTDYSDDSLKLQGHFTYQIKKKRWYSSQKSVVRQLKQMGLCLPSKRQQRRGGPDLCCRLFHARGAGVEQSASMGEAVISKVIN